MMPSRTWAYLGLSLICGVLASAAPPAHAEWPERTVKVVVPYGVGGITDTMARLTADRLGKILNQPFVVEAKPGAGGAIGINFAMQAPQDGYTILFVGSTLFTVLPLIQKVDYVPLKDLLPVSITGTNGMIMAVAKDAPYASLADFIAYTRANPGKVNYSSGGAGGNNHLSSAYLAGKLGLEMVHVPFRGGQPAMQAVLSKSVDMHFVNASDLIELIQSGDIRALAVSTLKRMPQIPDVPTVAESVPEFEYLAWNGYAVTGGVPKEVVSRLSGALRTVAQDQTVIEIFAKLGIDSLGSSPEEALDIIRKDIPLYARIIDMAALPKVQR